MVWLKLPSLQTCQSTTLRSSTTQTELCSNRKRILMQTLKSTTRWSFLRIPSPMRRDASKLMIQLELVSSKRLVKLPLSIRNTLSRRSTVLSKDAWVKQPQPSLVSAFLRAWLSASQRTIFQLCVWLVLKVVSLTKPRFLHFLVSKNLKEEECLRCKMVELCLVTYPTIQTQEVAAMSQTDLSLVCAHKTFSSIAWPAVKV